MASLPEIVATTVSDVAASGAAIHFDAPGGLFDRLLWSMEQNGFSPKTRNGCLAVLAGTLTAQSLVRQRIGNSPIGNFFSGVLGSTVRQVGRRALNRYIPDASTAIQPFVDMMPLSRQRKGRETLFEIDEQARTRLLQHYKRLKTDDQRRLYQEVMRSDAEQLRCIAEMPFEDLEALLSLLVQPSFIARINGKLEQVAETLFPWMR